ncbi:MAG TPA: LPS export ABC transporter periplasmic protein LptC [Terriglobales bacterium]|nr:LPS export ABC transporter periplasmic protein LptC [Terriglobales bacterium]
MSLNIPRLRRWFATGAIAIAVIVAGAYFLARWRFSQSGRQVPKKIDVQVQQTAEGFTISKSEEGRTVFTIRAGNAVQYKEGGHAELHNVSITVYGHDSRRFDQIYGSDFDYNPQSGLVTAKGEVQIDLQSNPAGVAQPDQTAPKELKNPVHLKTSSLVFNQKTGDAYTAEKVEFRVAQAAGSAVGAAYTAKDGVLDMRSDVNLVLTGPTPGTVTARHGTIRKEPRQIYLDQAHLVHGPEQVESDHATFFLRDDSTVDHALGTGNVRIRVAGKSPLDVHCERAELFMTEQQGNLRTAVLSGNVQMESLGAQPAHGSAGRVTLNFAGKNLLTTARAQENVKLAQEHSSAKRTPDSSSTEAANEQDIEITAPALDFVVHQGRRLKSAVTSGAAQIAILPADSATGQRTFVTAGRFNAKFDERNRLNSVHGEPDAKIVNRAPGQADKVSTSRMLDATFRPMGGIELLVQQGSVAYVDANLKAGGDRARYTPSDQMLYLTGSPRVVEGGMTTTARSMRMNRATGDAFADGDVKSTYSELKPQPNGALLASSSPIHVTARSMVAHQNPAVATYTGNARLWQDANVVEAPHIEFDREQRTVVAHGSGATPVSTALVQSGKNGKQTPVAITSKSLVYTDNDRKAHFEGEVIAKSADATLNANQADVYLQPRGDTEGAGNSGQPPAGASQIEKIIADGQVVIVQPNRRAKGNHLVYTADDDKFVLTGGPPSIFDAEHGKVTGDSLTFFRRDDRVLVEGGAKSPTVTQTRVAR